eukprot:768626-Hanusia_phi.AAC.10
MFLTVEGDSERDALHGQDVFVRASNEALQSSDLVSSPQDQEEASGDQWLHDDLVVGTVESPLPLRPPPDSSAFLLVLVISRVHLFLQAQTTQQASPKEHRPHTDYDVQGLFSDVRACSHAQGAPLTPGRSKSLRQISCRSWGRCEILSCGLSPPLHSCWDWQDAQPYGIRDRALTPSDMQAGGRCARTCRAPCRCPDAC